MRRHNNRDEAVIRFTKLYLQGACLILFTDGTIYACRSGRYPLSILETEDHIYLASESLAISQLTNSDDIPLYLADNTIVKVTPNMEIEVYGRLLDFDDSPTIFIFDGAKRKFKRRFRMLSFFSF